MGFLSWLGLSPRDASKENTLPDIQDNVRDSGQTFVFGRSNSGERVDEKSAMRIPTVCALRAAPSGIDRSAAAASVPANG